jgi:metal-dependent amidase/aminoacylase/carboxypeptidase family protein
VIASELKERLGQEVESRLEWLNGLYQHFHANPELS